MAHRVQKATQTRRLEAVSKTSGFLDINMIFYDKEKLTRTSYIEELVDCILMCKCCTSVLILNVYG